MAKYIPINQNEIEAYQRMIEIADRVYHREETPSESFSEDYVTFRKQLVDGLNEAQEKADVYLHQDKMKEE